MMCNELPSTQWTSCTCAAVVCPTKGVISNFISDSARWVNRMPREDLDPLWIQEEQFRLTFRVEFSNTKQKSGNTVVNWLQAESEHRCSRVVRNSLSRIVCTSRNSMKHLEMLDLLMLQKHIELIGVRRSHCLTFTLRLDADAAPAFCTSICQKHPEPRSRSNTWM